MPHLAFTHDWIQAWAAEIRASDEYRSAAERWEWPLLFVLRADPAQGVPEQRATYLDVHRGECREARVGSDADAASVPFVISGDVGTWKEIVTGGGDPILAIMRGKLRLDKGNIMTLAMHTAAAKALVATAARVDTVFPEAP